MECSDPGAIRDDELFAYLAGETVRPAVRYHLAHCQSCSAQLTDYRRIELKLIKKLYRWDCPPNQVLGEYQLGLLNREQSVVVERHLRSCVLCAAEVATLAQFLTNDPLLEPVPASSNGVSVRAALNNHAQDAKRVLDDLRQRSSAGVRRIVATLVPPPPRLAFERDQHVTQATWPRSYSAEDVNVSIQVERDTHQRNTLQLIGFVTRKGAVLEALKGVPVQLSSPAREAYSQNIDELGNFVFSAVAPSVYTLELQFPERVVVIDQLVVNAEE